jgi:hypothetical protein
MQVTSKSFRKPNEASCRCNRLRPANLSRNSILTETAHLPNPSKWSNRHQLLHCNSSTGADGKERPRHIPITSVIIIYNCLFYLIYNCIAYLRYILQKRMVQDEPVADCSRKTAMQNTSAEFCRSVQVVACAKRQESIPRGILLPETAHLPKSVDLEQFFWR